MRTALVVVDVQRDFCPGGALEVKKGDEILPPLNNVIKTFASYHLPVFFTRDWHPPNHTSFKSQGGVWPPHCVQNTPGAEFHPGLAIPTSAIVVSKGDKPAAEAYSGFQGTDLQQRLKASGVDRIVIGGLATDYCVKETCLDALRAGLAVSVLEDCVRAVDVKPRDGVRALKAMQKSGATLSNSRDTIRRMASTQQ
jgi:nicotinamidase/pyrazinamidase